MKLESVKKHEQSRQHKDSEAAQRASVDEWPELKLRVQEIRSLEPMLGYLPMWQRILNESKMQPVIPNILALVKITLVIPVLTAILEQGFSLMKWVKGDWRNRL